MTFYLKLLLHRFSRCPLLPLRTEPFIQSTGMNCSCSVVHIWVYNSVFSTVQLLLALFLLNLYSPEKGLKLHDLCYQFHKATPSFTPTLGEAWGDVLKISVHNTRSKSKLSATMKVALSQFKIFGFLVRGVLHRETGRMIALLIEFCSKQDTNS